MVLPFLQVAASRESFSSFQSFDGPSIQMGNNSKVQTKGKGSIQLEHGRFKDVLFVPSLASNLLFASISVPHTLVTETCAPIRSSLTNGANDYK